MSLRAAINAKCKDCIYDPKSGHGTWRQQVEGCTVTRCALFPVRPRAQAPKDPAGNTGDRFAQSAPGELTGMRETVPLARQ
jgi:hypothetical protein